MDPTAGLRLALGHVSVNIGAHVGQEGNDVVVGHGLDVVDLGLYEVGVGTNPGSLVVRDANGAKLGLRLAGEHLNLLPDGVLVLKGEDVPHLGTGVALDHVPRLSRRCD